MLKKWLSLVNLSIGGLIVVLLAIATSLELTRPSEIASADSILSKRSMPSNSFKRSVEAYEAIGKAPFQLKSAPLAFQLPDLRRHMNYCGRNGRPDANPARPVLHFGFVNNTVVGSATVGQKMYILYDRSRSPAQYVPSPGNAETPMWIEPSLQGNDVVVKAFIKNEKGEIINEPPAHAKFILQEKDAGRIANRAWEIGKWRVDGSLLARQRARWMGPDLFLEHHGGEEFNVLKGKHRIEFTDGDDAYSVYVGLGNCLVWKDGNHWTCVEPGEQSMQSTIMLVKKIDERLMNFEIWDVDGKNKVILNLIKTNEPWMPNSIQDTFKFQGTRTRSQYIFELGDQRMFISPKDWLLQTEEGWIKLATPEQIDDYVARRQTGVLFVFDEVRRFEGRQVLMGSMYNSSRTDIHLVELFVQQKTAPVAAIVNTDEDDDEMDDEEEVVGEYSEVRPPLPVHAEKRTAFQEPH